MDVCLSARTNVSCATSSAQSRSPNRRVRYLTNAALYVRKSRSTSVTQSPAVPQHCQLTIAQTFYTGRGQLDRHAAPRDDHAISDRERIAQVGLQLDHLEVRIGERLDTQHLARLLVAHVGPHAVTQNESDIAGATHTCVVPHSHGAIRGGHTR